MHRFILIIVLSFLMVIPRVGTAQENTGVNRFWTYGFNFGMIGWSPSSINKLEGTNFFTRVPSRGIASLSDNSGRSYPSLLANTSLGLHAGHNWISADGNHLFSVFGEFQLNRCVYQFLPPFQYEYLGQLIGAWIEMDKYFKYSAGFQYGYQLSGTSRLGGSRMIFARGSFGETFFHRNGFAKINPGEIEDWRNVADTGFVVRTIRANTKTQMLSLEIGLRQYNESKTRSLDLGISAHLPYSASYVREYEFFKNNSSVGKSEVTFHGSTILLNLRYQWGYPRAPKKERIKRDRNHEYIAQNNTVNDRNLDVQSTFTSREDSVVVEIYDRGSIDGDVVSLYLNGELILKDFTLAREKMKVKLDLKPGDNYLVMVAENMGSQPPNTAAMDIDIGGNKKSVDIVSNEKKNGTISIFYKPR